MKDEVHFLLERGKTRRVNEKTSVTEEKEEEGKKHIKETQ